jgi:ribosomal protein S6/ribosomal protein S18
MRLYEFVYIVDPALEEAAVDEKLTRLHDLATASDGAEVVAVDHWGVRQLAYPIKGHLAGYYVVAHVRGAAEDLPEFERITKLEESVLRYIVVLNDGEPTNGMSVLVEKPVREEAEDAESEASDDDDDSDRDRDRDDDDGPPQFSGGQGRRRRSEGPAIELLNYKDVSSIARFLTEQGKILPRRTTHVTAGFQRQLGRAVKRARYLSLIPYLRNNEG